MGLKRKTWAAGLLLPILLLSYSMPSAAENPFYSYTYDAEENPVFAPDAVVTDRVITGSSLGTANFSNPSDLFVAETGELYLVDTDTCPCQLQHLYPRQIHLRGRAVSLLSYDPVAGVQITSGCRMAEFTCQCRGRD